jgi:hypothetical protein
MMRTEGGGIGVLTRKTTAGGGVVQGGEGGVGLVGAWLTGPGRRTTPVWKRFKGK